MAVRARVLPATRKNSRRLCLAIGRIRVIEPADADVASVTHESESAVHWAMMRKPTPEEVAFRLAVRRFGQRISQKFAAERSAPPRASQ
jgi:hypothetical protein